MNFTNLIWKLSIGIKEEFFKNKNYKTGFLVVLLVCNSIFIRQLFLIVSECSQ